ncbi:MAG: hypothetical protein RR593_07050 [Hungatella sp.]
MSNQMMKEQQILTIKDCMSRHDKSYDTIAALFKRKGSPAFRVGREWQVKTDKWDAYLLKLAETDKS